MGAAHRRGSHQTAAGRRSQRGGVRRLAGGARAQNRLRDRGHGGTAAHQNQPDGRARKDAADRGASDPFGATRSVDGDRGDDRPERPGTGAHIYGDERGDGHHPDQARRDRQGRRGGGDCARAEPPDPLRRRRRAGGRSAAVRPGRVRGLAVRLSPLRPRPRLMKQDYMEEALELAARGRGRVSPGPAVGAVIVREAEIVGRGFYTARGVRHAEVLAIEEAGELARGATMYVTLEPHCFTGRTPPCTAAILRAGIKKVVAAMEDPNPRVSGRGFGELRAGGVEVEITGEYAARAAALNEAFVHFMRTGRPLVTMKAAVTLDGKIAAPEDNQGWITSDQARARPLLRIVLDSQLRLPADSKMVESCAGDVLVVTTSAASAERRRRLESKGVRVEVLEGPDGRADLNATIELLGREQYLSLMIEAGSRVNWTALESAAADKIFFYYAPKILGGVQSLPVAGGIGRRRRIDAIRFRGLKIHSITPDEFAVEAYLEK